jgi:hypothetical protein
MKDSETAAVYLASVHIKLSLRRTGSALVCEFNLELFAVIAKYLHKMEICDTQR